MGMTTGMRTAMIMGKSRDAELNRRRRRLPQRRLPQEKSLPQRRPVHERA
jgi:hypothetical protein